MESIKQIKGETEAELWQKFAADLSAKDNVLKYSALLLQPGQETFFDIDIDLGGGFESGISTTRFRTALPATTALRFNIHEQDLLNEIGKVLGMEDIKLGYPEFDAAFIVQANNPNALKRLFAEESIRSILLKHPTAKLKLDTSSNPDAPDVYLSFSKNEAIVEITDLREIYHLLRYLTREILTLSA
ncbi:hypothetical protein ACFSKU_10170 [Pontibacter silvestris]|uniref:DUF3137 domain-containing protein n=1 Tax=Pontibacter silvestris TaxID=2305183 RepID=A0ABW4WX70_9BACT|nr:hypothetical protein [Pontibacter silvestris]MCC9136796.1 hypothetical protein [Pontibacter silvestris]